MSNVLSFLHRVADSQDWSQQEVAEFYRVENALLQSGFAVTTERGVSDEGDPWFVFCREDNQDVIAHFARIGREYVIVSSFHQGTLRGRDFRALVREMLESHPLMVPMRRRQGQKVFLHPAALLTALVASAYVVSSEKLPGDSGGDGHGKNASIASLLMEKFSAIAAAVFAAAWIERHSDSLVQYFDKHLFHAASDEHAVHVASDSHPHTALQTDQNVQLAAHRLPSGDGTNLLVTDQTHATGPVPASTFLPSISSVLEKAGASNSPASPDGGGQTADVNHADGFVATADQPAALPRNPGTELTAATDPLAAAQGAQSSSAAVPADASHLIVSEVGNSSAQTVVLSTSPTPLNQALQEAFQQVGLDPGLARSLSASTSQTSPTPATDTTNSNQANSIPAASQSDDSQSSPYSVVHTDPQGHTNVTFFGVPTDQAHISQVAQVVLSFELNSPSYEIAYAGANTVFIDTNAADGKSAHYGVITWDFADGSTLSIVGIMPAHAQSVTA